MRARFAEATAIEHEKLIHIDDAAEQWLTRITVRLALSDPQRLRDAVECDRHYACVSSGVRPLRTAYLVSSATE